MRTRRFMALPCRNVAWNFEVIRNKNLKKSVGVRALDYQGVDVICRDEQGMKLNSVVGC